MITKRESSGRKQDIECTEDIYGPSESSLKKIYKLEQLEASRRVANLKLFQDISQRRHPRCDMFWLVRKGFQKTFLVFVTIQSGDKGCGVQRCDPKLSKLNSWIVCLTTISRIRTSRRA
jgi:hypothetical protein